MFLIPSTYAFQWKQLPRLALGLAALLTLIFLCWHPADRERERALTTQYSQELLSVEWPLYETHLLKTNRKTTLQLLKTAKENGDIATLTHYMGADDAFADSIRQQGKDYLPEDILSAWVSARSTFDAAHKKLSAEALGVDPEHFRLITFLTFNLVQPSAAQWLGAILLLITAGMALEIALGGGAVLAGFLGGGLMGAFAYLLSNGSGVLPLSGAGAGVAGVVGIFALHFRLQKLKLFGSVELSAAFIPLLWIIFLAAEYFLSNFRPAELAAQIAGAATAPLWLFIYKRWFFTEHTPTNTELELSETEADLNLIYREKLQVGLDLIAAMEFVGAQKHLREMVKAYPQDLRVLIQLYHLEKLTPQSTSYDAVSRRLFLLGAQREEGAQMILPIYRDYEKQSLAKSALDTEVSLRLVMRFARIGEVKDAEKIMKSVLSSQVTHPLLAKASLALAQAFEQLQDPARAEQYRGLAKAS